MQLDYETVFSWEQDASGNGATTVSTNFLKIAEDSVPFGHLGRFPADKGAGCNKTEIAIVATDDAVGGTSVRAELWTDDDDGFGTERLVARSRDVPVADIVKGFTFNVPSEFHEGTSGRFVRLKYVTVGNVTQAEFSAFVVKSRQTA